MSSIVPRALRRAAHVGSGSLVALIAAAAVGAGVLDGTSATSPGLAAVLWLASLAVLVVATIARRLRFQEPSARAQRVSFWLRAALPLADIEVTLALTVCVYALFSVTGGLSSPLYPLLYGAVAFGVTFQGRAGAMTAVAAALVLEAAVLARGSLDSSLVLLASTHVAVIIAAAVAHALFFRAMVSRFRREHRRRIREEIRAQRANARDYRLITASLGAESRGAPSRIEEEHMLAVGGVQVIASGLYYVMGLIKSTLKVRTCILLWVDEGRDSLKIKELVTESDDVTESSRVRSSGVLGAIVHDQTCMVLSTARPGQVPYVESSDSVGAFAGVPIMEGAHLRGVLCVDRPEAFTDSDVELLSNAAEQVLRSIQAEHVFRAVERSKYEHERFYHASAMLVEALTVEQVVETAFSAAVEIVEHEFAAITLFDAEQKMHRVLSVRAREGTEPLTELEKLSGLEFRPNSGLVSMVVKNKHYLPAGGELRSGAESSVFTKRIKLRDAESLLVLPLMSADEAIGTFTLASRNPHRFRKDVREMLRVIANQVAVSVQNALLYRKMETMATTDGLTGLTNHRSFQERFENLLERADRHGRGAAMLLCDVDHFKNVNDTYGHPVGDEVLRQVAGVLRAAVRKIDIPARYGGEEFAVVLEETDLDGALQLADRIRRDVAALQLGSDQGTFQITMSVGVSAFPDDSRDRAELIERSDMALYHAKETGRNRVISYQQFVADRRKKAS